MKQKHSMKLIYVLFEINCSQTVITKTRDLLAMSFEFPILHNGHRFFSIPEECYRLIVQTALMDNLARYSSIFNEYLKVFKLNTTTKLAHLVRLGNSRCSEFPVIRHSSDDMVSTMQFDLTVNDMTYLLLFAELVFFFWCWDLLSMQYHFSHIKIELLTLRFLFPKFAIYIWMRLDKMYTILLDTLYSWTLFFNIHTYILLKLILHTEVFVNNMVFDCVFTPFNRYNKVMYMYMLLIFIRL